MHTIQQIGPIEDAVANTLFVPLYLRHRETLREDGMITDRSASRIVQSVDYDFSKYESQKRGQIGVCIRVRHFDRLTKQFIDTHDNPVVVNLGCGLDTRSERVGTDKAIFYHIDLPEVMRVRDKLLPPDERNISISQSMFDPAWAQEIRQQNPKASFLVISEGVFFYFEEEQVRPVLETIARHLSPGELLFDGLSTTGCKLSARMSKKINAPFKWGLDDDRQPEKWASNLRFADVAYYMDYEKHRWDKMARVMSIFPFFTKGFKMLRYRIAPA